MIVLKVNVHFLKNIFFNNCIYLFLFTSVQFLKTKYDKIFIPIISSKIVEIF